MILEFLKTIESECGAELRLSEPLSSYTGFRTGGPAKYMFLPKTAEELSGIVTRLKRQSVPFFLLGNGSNIIAMDEGYNGVVVCTKKMQSSVSVEGDVITVSAGAMLIDLCEAAARESLAGAEFAYGIPGTVGGAVYMNAGAYGGEIKDILLWVDAVNDEGEVVRLSAEDCRLGYRTSVFHSNSWTILSAAFRLERGEEPEIRAKMAELMGRRRDKQPLNLPSCGSTFKRPEGAFAGALIEQCGLKGFRVGGAGVSEKHAGFVVNNGGATTADILSVISHVHDTVLAETGFELKCEVRFME